MGSFLLRGMVDHARHRPLVPLLLGLARDCRRRRILDFQPAVGAARAIRRAEALRHDAFATERTSLAVDDRSVRDEVRRVECDASCLPRRKRLQI